MAGFGLAGQFFVPFEIEFASTNRTENSSINISEFSSFNPTLIELAQRVTCM